MYIDSSGPLIVSSHFLSVSFNFLFPDHWLSQKGKEEEGKNEPRREGSINVSCYSYNTIFSSLRASLLNRSQDSFDREGALGVLC